MTTKEVKIGSTYEVKLGGEMVPVRLTSVNPAGGWFGINCNTNRQIRLKSCRRFKKLLREVTEKEAKVYERQAEANAPFVATEVEPPPQDESLPTSPDSSEVFTLGLSADWQGKLDECVWKYGPRVNLAGDYIIKLSEFCLYPDMVTNDMLDLAVRRYKERIALNMTSDELHWGPPFEEENGVGTMQVWRTQCGQYRVARIGGAEPRFSAVSRIVAASARESIIANDLRSLQVAFELTEKWHMARSGKPVLSNAGSRIIEAEGMNLDKRPNQQNLSPPRTSDSIMEKEYPDVEITLTKEGEILMKTTLKAIHRLLIACGLAKKETVAEKYPLDRVQRKLASKDNFDQLIVQSKSNPEGDEAKLLVQIGKALTDGGKIELADAKGKPDKKASAKKPSAEKSKKKTKPSKNGAPRKKREGMALIDAAFQVLTEKKKAMSPVDMIEVIEKKGLWKRAGKTPEQSLASRIYVEMAKLKGKARFKKGEEKGTFALK